MKPLLPLVAAAALAAPGLASAATTTSASSVNAAISNDLGLPNPTWATDMSGLWVVSSSLSGTQVMIDCNVIQIGEVLYGSCEPEAQGATPAALLGHIDGANANWSYTVQDQGRQVALTYQATVASNTAVSGTLTYGGSPSSFTAARK